MKDYNLRDIEEEPQFLVNDFLVEAQNKLQKVIQEIKKKPKPYENKAIFLKNFMNALLISHNKNKTNKKTDLVKIKKELFEKKKELIQKILTLKEQEKLHQEIPLPKKQKENIKELIISKITNNPIVTREIKNNNYILKEPNITEEQKQFIASLKKQLKRKDYDNEELIKNKITEKYKEEYDNLRYFVIRDTKALGKISPLLDDKEILSIVCEGPNQSLIINYQDKPNLKTNIHYSKEELNKQIQILARVTGKELSITNPFLDSQIQNKFDIQANLGSDISTPRFIIKRKN